MKTVNKFTIPFSGLKDEIHQFDFQIDKKFFDAFGYDEFNDVAIDISVELNKKTTFLELNFVAEGYVRVPCDVTGEDFNLEIQEDFLLIVKFGEAFNNEDEELLILPHQAHEVEVQQYIYELIVLAVPQKRVNPSVLGGNQEEIKEQLEKKDVTKEEVDPRWDQLKQLLDKNKNL